MNKLLMVLVFISVLFITGCDNTITGNTARENEDIKLLLSDCVKACAKCNPVALSEPCQENCESYFKFGGINKLKQHTELYTKKCKSSI